MTFHLRIFFYGLIAFVPGGQDGITALMVNAPDHIAYMAFNKEDVKACSPSPCMAVIERGADGRPRKLVPGFNLAGVQIDVPMIPKKVLVSSSRATFPLPRTSTEASAFSWIPVVSEVLGAPAKIDPDCMKAPYACNGAQGLAGRILFSGGGVNTCLLAANCANGATQMRVHSYHFDPQPRDGKPDQALSELVQYEVELAGSELKLALTTFQGASAGSATLKPHSCSKGNCVDIFLAVMPPRTQRCDPRIKGDHFKFLYNLIKPTPASSPIPVKVPGTFIPADDIPSLCGASIPAGPQNLRGHGIVGRFKAFLAERRGRYELAEILKESAPGNGVGFPASRPICPMAIIDQ